MFYYFVQIWYCDYHNKRDNYCDLSSEAQSGTHF